MAQDVSELPQGAAEEELPFLPDRRERARRSSYRFRFGILYVALAAIVGAGVGAFIVLATQPSPEQEEAWSAWRPEGRENAYPVEIAQHVGPRYRLDGRQIVGVLAGKAEMEEAPLRAVLIQHDSSTPAKRDDVEVIGVGSSVVYNLCGAGEKCSILGGSPSVERSRLLRREALELALYTFKYVDGVNSVLALMPVDLREADEPEDDLSTVVFLQKKDFDRQLSLPLSATLPGRPSMNLDPGHARTVDALTVPREYVYDIQPTQDLGAILRLARLSG